MELIIICLWDVEKCSKNTTINLFWRRNMRYAAPLLWASSEVLIFWKNSRCSTPNNSILKGVQKTFSRIQFLLPQLPSCDIKTNENFTGFGFSERCWKIATSKLYKTRSEQKCIFDGVKFISVTILKHGLTTKQQTRFGKTEIIWTLITTQNKNHFYNYYHHLF